MSFAVTLSREIGKRKALTGPSMTKKGRQKQKPRTQSSVAASTSPSLTPPTPANTEHPFLQFTVPEHIE